MEAEQVTTLNLRVVLAEIPDAKLGLVGLPWPRRGVVILRDAVKAPKKGGR